MVQMHLLVLSTFSNWGQFILSDSFLPVYLVNNVVRNYRKKYHLWEISNLFCRWGTNMSLSRYTKKRIAWVLKWAILCDRPKFNFKGYGRFLLSYVIKRAVFLINRRTNSNRNCMKKSMPPMKIHCAGYVCGQGATQTFAEFMRDVQGNISAWF